MNKTLKLLALLVFTGAALNACVGCNDEVEEPKTETEEVKVVVDTEVEEAEKSE